MQERIIFNALTELCEDSTVFYSKDFTLDDVNYRIFNYRLASYTDFLRPYALECRGIMFEVNRNGEFIRLAARPMEKFFNINENPFTMDINPNDIRIVLDKADGSLISTFEHKGSIRVKSKESLTSSQAVGAQDLIDNDEVLKAILHHPLTSPFTFNFEYVAPTNTIVLHYSTPRLILLNVRDRESGEYLDRSVLNREFPTLKDYWCEEFTDLSINNDFFEEAKKLEDREGYVVRMKNDQHIKVKTDWYLVRHRIVDKTMVPYHLFCACVYDATDDARSLFVGNSNVLTFIDRMEKIVHPLYNAGMQRIETFYEENKGLGRKEYAIKAKDTFTDEFYLAMNMYIGKEVDYKEYMTKRSTYKQLDHNYDITNRVYGGDQ